MRFDCTCFAFKAEKAGEPQFVLEKPSFELNKREEALKNFKSSGLQHFLLNKNVSILGQGWHFLLNWIN